MDRIIIIGNSGSGKSYLAARLGTRLSIPTASLDDLYWEPGGINTKRPQTIVLKDIETIKQNRQWIVEGVFGELAARFLDKADCLIWLDMDWNHCRSNLLHRGSEGEKQLDLQLAEANFQKLLIWAAGYWAREDPRSYSGHKELFNTFEKCKRVLRSRDEVDVVIGDPSTLK